MDRGLQTLSLQLKKDEIGLRYTYFMKIFIKSLKKRERNEKARMRKYGGGEGQL